MYLINFILTYSIKIALIEESCFPDFENFYSWSYGLLSYPNSFDFFKLYFRSVTNSLFSVLSAASELSFLSIYESEILLFFFTIKQFSFNLTSFLFNLKMFEDSHCLLTLIS